MDENGRSFSSTPQKSACKEEALLLSHRLMLCSPFSTAGQGLRNVEAAESSHDSSLDMSNFQISSVPLKTPDAVKAKTMAAVVTAPTGLSTMATPAAVRPKRYARLRR